MSTGMSDFNEVKNAFGILVDFGQKKEEITIMHCTSNYPASPESLNLNAIKTIHQKLNVNTGYSDHSLGSEAAISAVTLGAKIIEK